MFILRDILTPLQQDFSDTAQGKKRSIWFTYTLLAVVVPFTSSMTSNLLRSLEVLFGIKIPFQRFYAFMGSSTLPWAKLWSTLWGMIPDPATEGRIIVAIDDSINPKTGKKIFGCGNFHNHAAKKGESSYPWSQCILVVGLLKQVKGRWACLPLSFRFYMMQKDIEGSKELNHKKTPNTLFRDKRVTFETKMKQAATMLEKIYEHFQKPVLAVADSWFGNNGLWSLLEQVKGGEFDLLSRLRSNAVLHDLLSVPVAGAKRGRGRPRKYGERLGNVEECATTLRGLSSCHSVYLYGKQRKVEAYSLLVMIKTLRRKVRVVWVWRKTQYVALFTTDLSLSVEQIIEYYGARWKIESGFKELKQEIGSSKSQTRDAQAVTNHLHFCTMATTLIWIYADQLQHAPDRKYKIRGRASFAFSDVRRVIADAALNPDFQAICPKPTNTAQNSFVRMLLRMVA